MQIDPRFPVVTKQQRETPLEAKKCLEGQAPKDAPEYPFEEKRRDV
jgi:hypothetical protein